MSRALAVPVLLAAVACGQSRIPPTSPSPAAGATFAEHASEHFTIFYTTLDAPSVAHTAASLERDYARITAALGVSATPRIRVFLYTTREAMQAAVRPAVGELPAFASGLVTGADAVHILSPELPVVWSYETGLRALTHELAHCVSLAINPRIANNPRWLWEAVAVYEAGQFVDPRTLPYLAGGAAPALDSLNGFDNTRVYDVGYLIAEFVVSRWGRDGLVGLIATDGNLGAVTGLNATEFVAAWRDFLRSRYGV